MLKTDPPSIKTIFIVANVPLRKKTDQKEEILKRIVHTDEWKLFAADFLLFPHLEHEIVLSLIFSRQFCTVCNLNLPRRQKTEYCTRISKARKHCNLLMKLVANKISGYKQQDVIKSRFSQECFITKDDVLDLLFSCQLRCHYCQNPTKLFHEEIYDPQQFSLDRIDNDLGHNFGNIFVSCLRCNLRRRRQHSDKFKFSRQLVIRKLD